MEQEDILLEHAAHLLNWFSGRFKEQGQQQLADDAGKLATDITGLKIKARIAREEQRRRGPTPGPIIIPHATELVKSCLTAASAVVKTHHTAAVAEAHEVFTKTGKTRKRYRDALHERREVA